MMKTLTAMAVVLAASISVANADSFTNTKDNDSFVAQIGNANYSNVSQTGGNNAQATVQLGGDITGSVFNPQYTANFGLGGNSSTTNQTGDMGVANASLTIQAGNGNYSNTNQYGGVPTPYQAVPTHNTSITFQDGTNNSSTVSQHR
ncbi:MAG TPA: hypothetical protein VFC56_19420 [Stellaceae bacterium]|nr:hypothetical protein [Stellaceae bacterium]